MIMSTVGVDYPRLGNSLLAPGKPLGPFWSLSLGSGERSTWGGAASKAPSALMAVRGETIPGHCGWARRNRFNSATALTCANLSSRAPWEARKRGTMR